MSPEIGLDSVQLSRLGPTSEVAVTAYSISSLVPRDGGTSRIRESHQPSRD